MDAPRRTVIPATPPFTAVILAGGRGSRLGGVDKPLLRVGEVSLLDRALDAAADAGAAQTVVAGPRMLDRPGFTWVREEPPFGGPVAGLIAALRVVEHEWVLLLAADLPRAGEIARLLAHEVGCLAPDADGAVLVDADGRPQILAAMYRTARLRDSVAVLPDAGRNAAMRAVTDPLVLAQISVAGDVADDVDTWEDLERARRAEADRIDGGRDRTMAESPRTLPVEALDEWAAALRERFDLADEDVPVLLILDLARDVANGVARPAAPLSAFVAGLVAGRAGSDPREIESATRAIVELAEGWKH